MWEMGKFWGVQEQGTAPGGTGDAQREAPSCLRALRKGGAAVPCLRCCGLSQGHRPPRSFVGKSKASPRPVGAAVGAGKGTGGEGESPPALRAKAVEGVSPRAAGCVLWSGSPGCQDSKPLRPHPAAGLSPQPTEQPGALALAGCHVDTPVHSSSEPCWEDRWTGKTELEASILLVILPRGEGHLGFPPTLLLTEIYLFTVAGRNVTATADCFRCFNIRLYWRSPASPCTSITLSIRITGTNKAALLPPAQLCGLGRPSDYLFRHAGSKLSTTQTVYHPFSSRAQHSP